MGWSVAEAAEQPSSRGLNSKENWRRTAAGRSRTRPLIGLNKIGQAGQAEKCIDRFVTE